MQVLAVFIFCSHLQQDAAATHNAAEHLKVKRPWAPCFVHRTNASGMMLGLRARIETQKKRNAFDSIAPNTSSGALRPRPQA
jgi:hypothetical protein